VHEHMSVCMSVCVSYVSLRACMSVGIVTCACDICVVVCLCVCVYASVYVRIHMCVCAWKRPNGWKCICACKLNNNVYLCVYSLCVHSH